MRCVLLVGEPGIGKSRMLRAFRDSLADEAHETVAFHGSPYHQDSPFWPVLQRLQQAFGLGRRLAARAKLRRAWSRRSRRSTSTSPRRRWCSRTCWACRRRGGIRRSTPPRRGSSGAA